MRLESAGLAGRAARDVCEDAGRAGGGSKSLIPRSVHIIDRVL